MHVRFLTASIFALSLLQPQAAFGARVDPDAATPVQREQAQARFARGRQLFGDKKFKEALTEFEGSLEIVASPNARLYIAHCDRELGELVAAYEAFGRAETEAKELAAGDPRYLKTAESAKKERDALAPKLGFLNVSVQNAAPETTLSIAGEQIKSAAWSEAVPVLPGKVEIVAETPGRPRAQASVDIAAGEKKQIALEVAPLAPAIVATAPPAPRDGGPRSSTLRTASYVAVGVGAAGFITFAITGAMAKSTYDSLARECGGPCAINHDDQMSAGRTQQAIANVGLGIGIVGVVAAVPLFLLGRSGAAPDAPRTALSIGPGSVAVRGVF